MSKRKKILNRELWEEKAFGHDWNDTSFAQLSHSSLAPSASEEEELMDQNKPQEECMMLADIKVSKNSFPF